MDNFWYIPIAAMIIGCAIGAWGIEYKVNTVWPNAIIELDELNSMSCDQIKEKNSVGRYWTPDNGKFSREKGDACVAAEKANNKRIKEKYTDENGELTWGLMYKDGIAVDDLQRILDYCDYTGSKDKKTFFGMANQTHEITTETCIWESTMINLEDCRLLIQNGNEFLICNDE